MKTSKKILSLILTVALVSSINWGYFTQLLNLTKSAAIELVTGGSVAGAALVAELNDLSISKFFEFNIDDFLVNLFDEIIHDDSEDNTTTEDVAFEDTTEETDAEEDESGINSNNPSSYLQRALKNQALEEIPSRFKAVWVEGDYKYTVRVHEGNSKYTDADSIHRISRQSTILDEHGQGTGLEYLGTDGNWYHESVLTEFFKGGTPNPKFNEEAARMTHIPISGGN